MAQKQEVSIKVSYCQGCLMIKGAKIDDIASKAIAVWFSLFETVVYILDHVDLLYKFRVATFPNISSGTELKEMEVSFI